MSIVITRSRGMNTININAHDEKLRFIATGTDFLRSRVDITGTPKAPLFSGVRFFDCEIIAENMLSFDNCYFDESCNLIIEDQEKLSNEKLNKDK